MQCECETHSVPDNVSPQIAVAFEKLIGARNSLLDACNEDRQAELARLDENAWMSYEDEIVDKIDYLTGSLENLASIRSTTINDLALKFAAILRNQYASTCAMQKLEKDLLGLTQICPTCLEVNTVEIKRPRGSDM